MAKKLPTAQDTLTVAFVSVLDSSHQEVNEPLAESKNVCNVLDMFTVFGSGEESLELVLMLMFNLQ